MDIAVIGGTGTLGRCVAAQLAAQGDRVRILSRQPPAEAQAPTVEHRVVDVQSGNGLTEGLIGVEAVIDASNSTRRPAHLLVEGNRKLLAAERDAGVQHHVAISIVGCDKVPLSYYKVKVRQETVIADGPVPWSLLRATQFHPFVASFFHSADRLRILPTGAAKLQPIDVVDVAHRLVDVVQRQPAGILPEISGPEALTFTDLADIWRQARPRKRLSVKLPMVGRLGHALRDGRLCNPEAASSGTSFKEWLANHE